MYRNYFKTMLRNMRKNKLYTGINVVGMAVAFTCSILIFLTVYFMFGFDDFHENKDRLFKVYNYSKNSEGENFGTAMAYPMQPALLNEQLGIEKATLIKDAGNGVQYQSKDLELGVKLVDNDFFSMFSFPVVKGNHAAPLASPGDVVLTEHAAKVVFGNEEPVGKAVRVKISDKWQNLVVSAVLKDFPPNSTLRFDVLARIELCGDYANLKTHWDNQHSDCFVLLAKNATQQSVENRLRAFMDKYQPANNAAMQKEGFLADANGDYRSLRLYPMTGLHFNTKIHGGGSANKTGMYILLLIGVMILLIACFNFVNLSIGLSFNRSREMGIRKCLGAGSWQVWLQVFGESFFTCLAAMLLGLAISAVLIKQLAQVQATQLEPSMLFRPVFLLILLGVLALVAFIAGGYPSAIVSRLQTTEILKGKFTLNKSGRLRNGLLVAQFVIASVLICATVIIYQQFRYMRSAPLGYQTSSLVSIPIRNIDKSRQVIDQLRLFLGNQTTVVSVSGSSANLGIGMDRSTTKSMVGFDYKGESMHATVLGADYDILTTIGIKPLDGRDFSKTFTTDSANAVIISEGLARQFNSKELVGLSFYPDSSRPPLRVIGVIPDFHLYSMHEKADALMIMLNPHDMLGYALIKIKTQNPLATMDLIREAYAKVEPGVAFKGSFVDENVERWYKAEIELGRGFSLAAIVALILSCMGLFGIALIAIGQRVKEIGIRKVLGASVPAITAMVTKDFIKPVMLAMVIAIPISWWAMSQWLQEYVYRVQLHWWVFFLTAASAILIAVLTVSFQAIRAAIVNPVKSLRTE